MARRIHIVVVDPQNSFCRVVEPARQQMIHAGELCVPGAEEDMRRVATLINRLGTKLDEIHVTLDSRHPLHISHPSWFRDAVGNPPRPFTIMREDKGTIVGSRIDSSGTAYDVGQFNCFKSSVTRRTLTYLKALQTSGRYPHCIWPPHCLIGTPGHNVVPELMQAILDWTRLKGDTIVDFVTKGSNPYVEHFSAVRAEVIDPTDPTTDLNIGFIRTLQRADEVLFAGEAGSHSLANTVLDIADSFFIDEFTKKSVLLLDGTSPFAGSACVQDRFVAEMKGRGMKTTTTLDYLG